MSEFRDSIRYNEDRQDELEKGGLKARIDKNYKEFKKLNYENIKEELRLLEAVLKDYDMLRYYGEEIDEEDYGLLKYKIEKLSKKQKEIESEMDKEDEWEKFKNEELEQEAEGEERE